MIIIAPNEFKGTLNAFDVCRIVSSELSGLSEELRCFPLGDGGDGTAAIIASYLRAIPVEIDTCDALGRPNRSVYFKSGNTAIIELAAICGLKQLKQIEYDVMNANTAGLGIAINKAIQAGVRKIILCVGGSASIDGGTGALIEMGLEIVKSGNCYQNHIIEIESFNDKQLQDRFKNIELLILCDVDSSLCGTMGAARIFGPQKGASKQQIGILDHHLSKYAELITQNTGISTKEIKHGGAAGGVAAGFFSLLHARLISGAEYCLELSGLNAHLKTARWVITGEGRLDQQSLYGKIPGVIASKCNRQNIKVMAIAGSVEENMTAFDQIFTLLAYASKIEDAIDHPEHYLRLLCHDVKMFLEKNPD